MSINTARCTNPMSARNRKSPLSNVIFSFAVAVAGFIAWAPPDVGWLGLAVVPVILVGLAQTPRRIAALVACFYVGAAWRIVPSALGFGAELVIAIGALAATVAGHALIAWLVAWIINRLSKRSPSLSIPVFSRVSLYLFLTSAPPAGYLLLLPPIASTGAWFPGFGYAGFLLLAGLAALIAAIGSAVGTARLVTRAPPRSPRLTLLSGLFLIATGANLVAAIGQYGKRSLPSGWHAIDTQLPPLPDSADLLARTERHMAVSSMVEQAAVSSKASVFITPENIAGQWDAGAAFIWQPVLRKLKERQQTVFLGAVQEPVPSSGGGYYRKGLRVSVPSHDSVSESFFAAAQPVPFFEAGAQWQWSMRGRTVSINGQSIAPIICFEALTAWPMLSGFSRGDVATVHINAWWDRAEVRAIQQHTAQIWGRLFGVPVVTAINHPQSTR